MSVIDEATRLSTSIGPTIDMYLSSYSSVPVAANSQLFWLAKTMPLSPDLALLPEARATEPRLISTEPRLICTPDSERVLAADPLADESREKRVDSALDSRPGDRRWTLERRLLPNPMPELLADDWRLSASFPCELLLEMRMGDARLSAFRLPDEHRCCVLLVRRGESNEQDATTALSLFTAYASSSSVSDVDSSGSRQSTAWFEKELCTLQQRLALTLSHARRSLKGQNEAVHGLKFVDYHHQPAYWNISIPIAYHSTLENSLIFIAFTVICGGEFG